MSGRVSVLLADGRRVTGYRKTLRVNARRTPPHLLPDWKLSFILPPAIAFALAPGPVPGVIGARVDDLGRVEITGKRKDWVLGQAAVAWSKLCRRHAAHEIDAILTRDDEPGPTASGPIRKGQTLICKLAFDNMNTVVVWGSAMRRVSYPVPMQR